MQLIRADISEFEKNLYPKYKEIFPSKERKPLTHIKKLYNKGFLEIIEILDEENNEGIYIEVEKPEEFEQDINKQRRIKFYEKLGFYNLGYDLKLFDVDFATFVLPLKKLSQENKDIVEKIKEIYIAVLGKENYTQNCIIAKK